MHTDLSIIIPVLNESRNIRSAIDRILRQPFSGTLEIIVVDGDADGSTVSSVKDLPHTTGMISRPGRACQMNSGAEAAGGRVLCFLHCDTILPDNGLNTVMTTMFDPSIDVGAFDMSIDAGGFGFRMIEKTACLRSRLTRIPYGDQAVFFRASYFFELGRFKDIPIMEDVELMQRVKSNRGRLHILKEPVLTSARRWQAEGRLYTTLRNWAIRILYACGVSPDRLAKFYKNHPTNGYSK